MVPLLHSVDASQCPPLTFFLLSWCRGPGAPEHTGISVGNQKLTGSVLVQSKKSLQLYEAGI